MQQLSRVETLQRILQAPPQHGWTRCLVQGLPDGSLVMRNIPQGDTVSVGDTVFTSGLGGNLPRQILIGQITEVERRDYELFQSAIVQPTVDFEHLEIVLVITGFEPIEEPAPEDEGQ